MALLCKCLAVIGNIYGGCYKKVYISFCTMFGIWTEHLKMFVYSQPPIRLGFRFHIERSDPHSLTLLPSNQLESTLVKLRKTHGRKVSRLEKGTMVAKKSKKKLENIRDEGILQKKLNNNNNNNY